MSRFLIQSLCCLALATVAGNAEAAESIAYRLSDWKEMHFDDPGRASQHLAAVQKLGCEARQDSHDSHSDIVYRSPKWQALEVASDELAHQWEAWLNGAGFETLHGHAHDHEGNEHAGHSHADHDHAGHDHGPGEVEELVYRLPNWKTTHIEDQNQLPEFVALMKGLGCEVQSDGHDGHADVTVRCTQWKLIELPSHQLAEGWQNWLQQAGFDVRHTH